MRRGAAAGPGATVAAGADRGGGAGVWPAAGAAGGRAGALLPPPPRRAVSLLGAEHQLRDGAGRDGADAGAV